LVEVLRVHPGLIVPVHLLRELLREDVGAHDDVARRALLAGGSQVVERADEPGAELVAAPEVDELIRVFREQRALPPSLEGDVGEAEADALFG
jgi:hypothetical protein